MGNNSDTGTLVSRNPWKLLRAKFSKGARRTHTRALIARFHLRFLWFSSGFLFVFLGFITAGKWQESPRPQAPLGFRKIAGKESRAPSVSAAAYNEARFYYRTLIVPSVFVSYRPLLLQRFLPIVTEEGTLRLQIQRMQLH